MVKLVTWSNVKNSYKQYFQFKQNFVDISTKYRNCPSCTFFVSLALRCLKVLRSTDIDLGKHRIIFKDSYFLLLLVESLEDLSSPSPKFSFSPKVAASIFSSGLKRHSYKGSNFKVPFKALKLSTLLCVCTCLLFCSNF